MVVAFVLPYQPFLGRTNTVWHMSCALVMVFVGIITGALFGSSKSAPSASSTD
mgnify:CR=1 FL=1